MPVRLSARFSMVPKQARFIARAMVLAVAAVGFIVMSDARPVSAGSCGVITTPWAIPAVDPDCDGFSSAIETAIGTYPYVTCAATAARNDETDSWPLDFDDSQRVDVIDVLQYKGKVPHAVDPTHPKRYDLNNDNVLSVNDVLKFKNRSPGSCIIAPQPPVASRSFYLTTTDDLSGTDGLRNAGCAQADAPAGPINSVVVLHFGRPWYENGGYGVVLHSDTPATMGDVEEAAKDYLRGFWNCSDDDPARHVTLVIGTSNCVNLFPDCPPQGAPYSDWEHGQAWAAMVNSVNTWIDSPPSYRSRETAWGGNDIELDWNQPIETRSWVDGYSSSATRPYLNLGTAEGCPPAGICNGDWTQADVYYVSYGANPAWPLTEIYLEDGVNAAQWQRVSQDAGWMNFEGALTQRTACDQHPADPKCIGARNTPSQGWQQLWVLLNGNSSTADQLDWSTDISW